MTLTIILNAILGVGVIAVVVTPLVWAILTQQRDHLRLKTADAVTRRRPQTAERRRARPAQRRPIVEGI
jgi:hypothetical protein